MFPIKQELLKTTWKFERKLIFEFQAWHQKLVEILAEHAATGVYIESSIQALHKLSESLTYSHFLLEIFLNDCQDRWYEGNPVEEGALRIISEPSLATFPQTLVIDPCEDTFAELQMLCKARSVAIVIKDAAARNVWVNDHVAQLFNLPRQSLMNKTISQLLNNPSADQLVRNDLAALQTNQLVLVEESLQIGSDLRKQLAARFPFQSLGQHVIRTGVVAVVL